VAEKHFLREWVKSELGRGVGREDVIFAVCSRGRMRWEDAELFVAEVEEVHAAEIARRQSPALLLLSAVALTSGTVWGLVTVWTVLDALNRLLVQPSVMTPAGRETLAVVILSSPVAHRYLPQLMAALALALGGGLGILNSLETLRGR
jgi:hypothetical protein